MLTIYKASAGSGKTYTLTLEYIKILLGIKLTDGSERYVLNSDHYAPGGHRLSGRHRGILAITFTNAATEEMKSRIVAELSALATGGDSKYRDTLIALYGCTAHELMQVARMALSEMLYDYGNFNVSTIDSFFQTVLRTFSRELDQQGDYELSLNLDDVVAQAISMMLDDLNYGRADADGRLGRWIRRYVMDRLEQGGSYNFFNRSGRMLSSISASVARALNDETYTTRSERFRQYMEQPQLLQTFESELRSRIKDAATAIKASAQEFASAIAADGIPESAIKSGIMPRVVKAIDNPESLTIKDFDLAAFKMLTEQPDFDKFWVKKYFKEIRHLGDRLDEVFELARTFACEAVANVELIDIYAKIADSLPMLEFIGITERYMQEFLRQSNTVLISDTGELLKRIISDAEMPFIYERLGMKLESLLIDEFQDTSHLQWHNLRPLVANSIAQGRDSLIIGDEKQAIFRFRNSDSSLLGHLVSDRDFPDSHAMRGARAGENTNYRSAGGIVRFNNTLFRRIAADLDMDSYGNVVQIPSEAKYNQPAYIRLQFTPKGMEANGLFETMAAEIRRQHQSGYNWRDILILVRYRDEAKAIAEYLMLHHPDIKLLSSEALMLNSSSAVRTIIGILKLVERSYRAPSQVSEGPRTPYASRTDVMMMMSRFAYYTGEGFDGAAALELALADSADAPTPLLDQIQAIRSENPANLVALIEAIVSHKISARLRQKEYAYIAALQDLAIKHCSGADPSLATFLADYDRNIDKWAIKASSKLDAVEIMTLHKSKGLERACVHIPLADWKMRKTTEDIWLPVDETPAGFEADIVPPLLRITYSRNHALRTASRSPFRDTLDRMEKEIIADNLNLAYVAFTRASRELMVYSGTQNVGEWFANSLNRQDSAEELVDPSLMPLSQWYDAGSGTLTYGDPTTGCAEASAPDTPAGEYMVVRRDDTREITNIDDILTDDLDIGGEVEKEIVDRATDAALAEAARVGLNLHAVLSDVRVVDDLADAVRRLSLRQGLSVDEAADYLSKLQHAFDIADQVVSTWFSPDIEVFAERSIYLPATDETFRPDRVVVDSNGTVSVIDYKFTSEKREAHRRQVELYMSLMRRLGYDKVKGFLWYPLLGLTINV